MIPAAEEVAEHARLGADDAGAERSSLLDVLQRRRLPGDRRVDVRSRIEIVVSYQLAADLADIRALDHEIGGELPLQRRAEVLRIGRPQVWIGIDNPDRQRILRAPQAGEFGDGSAPEAARRLLRRFHLSQRTEGIFNAALTKLRRPTPGRLGCVRGLTVHLLIEDAVASAHDGLRVPVHVPRRTEARRDVVQVAEGEPGRQTAVAGKQNAPRRIRHDRRLHARRPAGMTTSFLIERNERFVAQPVVECEPWMNLVGVFDEKLMLHRGRTVVRDAEFDRRIVERANHEIRERIARAGAGKARRPRQRQVELERRPDEFVSTLQRVLPHGERCRIFQLPAHVVLGVHARVTQVDSPRH